MSYGRGRPKARSTGFDKARSESPLIERHNRLKKVDELIQYSTTSWPYDIYYSNVLSAVADAPTGMNDGTETVDIETLYRIQQDLASLINSSNERSSKCRGEATRIEGVKSNLIYDKQHHKDGQSAMDVDDDEFEDPPEFEEVKVKSEIEDEGEEQGETSTVNDMTGLQRISRSPTEHEKNPKSEFVEAQEIPMAALGLFEHSVQGLPHHGEKYLKKKYGVASYPSVDLKEMLPGEIPDQDFTRAKPPNQVQFSTFAAAIEPYFKTYGEEDLSFLKQRAVGGDSQYGRPGLASPYTIPPLGPLYTETWKAEDGANSGYTLSPPPPIPQSDVAKESEESLSDEKMTSNDVSCGPFASRLLAALLPERGQQVSENKLVDEDDNEELQSHMVDTSWKSSASKIDFNSLDERLKKEFRYIGILDVNLPQEKDSKMDETWDKEDDEVCYELRLLQKKLKDVTRVNQACKRRLIPMVQEQMAYQEYSTILEDLDKQVDQAYCKKFRNPKGKKKKGVATTTVSNAGVEKPNIKALMEKRQRWIDKIGPVFSPAEIMKRVPKESIFKNLQLDDDGEEEEEEEEDYGSTL